MSSLALILSKTLTIFSLRSDYNKLNYGTGGPTFGGPMDQLMRAIAPNCSQLILQCMVGNTTMNGFECCDKIFDPIPYFTAQGKIREDSYVSTLVKSYSQKLAKKAT